MNLSSKIEVKLPCGKKINLTNTLTYAGVDKIAAIMSSRLSQINFTHLYVRFASGVGDAKDPATSFNEIRDVRQVSQQDFKTEFGSSGYAVFDVTGGSILMTTDEDKYAGNLIRFPISFTANDLGPRFHDANQANYSIIYFMGLAERPQPSTINNFSQTAYDAGDYDTMLSVLEVESKDLFGIPSTGTVDIKYDLNLAV